MAESKESKPTQVTSTAAVSEEPPNETETKNVREAAVPAIEPSNNDVAELSAQLKEEITLGEETIRSEEDPDEVNFLLIFKKKF